MDFQKLSGAGNDFIIINNIVERIPAEKFSYIAKTLCRRRLSIGADGVMFIGRSDECDARMAFFNADGSEGEMCGNGARCVCRYVYEHRLAGKEQRIETVSGVVCGKRVTQRDYTVRLTAPSVVEDGVTVTALGEKYAVGYVELGVPGLPHVVIEYPGLKGTPEKELFALGAALRSAPELKKGANVNFYELTGENTAYIRTFERGVEDFTLACGTGTASTALILSRRGLISRGGFAADMAGGRLKVDIKTENGSDALYLTGPTNVVAEGRVLDEELHI